MTAFSDETGREPFQSPQHIIEGIILRRLHDKRIEGYTLEMSKEIEAALSAAPVAQEPVAYLRDVGQTASDGEYDECLVPASKGDPGAFAVYRDPPATPAGLGADEIARVFARWKNSKNLHESLAAQNIEKELLALLSRAGDQK